MATQLSGIGANLLFERQVGVLLTGRNRPHVRRHFRLTSWRGEPVDNESDEYTALERFPGTTLRQTYIDAGTSSTREGWQE